MAAHLEIELYIADTPCIIRIDPLTGHIDEIVAVDETGPRPITRTTEMIQNIIAVLRDQAKELGNESDIL